MSPAANPAPLRPIVVGVDGGNTKTVALVVAGDGTVLGAGRAGCGDIYGCGDVDGAFLELDIAMVAALKDAGLRADDLDGAAFSMAGADWPEDFVLLDGQVAERGYGRRRVVVNDAIGALRASLPEGVGVAITCGTGAAIGARSADGRIWHSSFWPDHAGGYQLGERAIRAAIRSHLGLAPPTLMTAPLLATLKVDTVEAMLHRRIHRGGTWTLADAAALAPIVLDAAHDGDEAALALVAAQGTALGDMGVVAANQTGQSGAFPIALTGGIFRHPTGLLLAAVVARLRRDLPEIAIVRAELEPVAGAVLLAFEALGEPVSPGRRDRLRATMPGHAFFSTVNRGEPRPQTPAPDPMEETAPDPSA